MRVLSTRDQIHAAWPTGAWRIPGPDSAIRTREGDMPAIEALMAEHTEDVRRWGWLPARKTALLVRMVREKMGQER